MEIGLSSVEDVTLGLHPPDIVPLTTARHQLTGGIMLVLRR